MAAILENEHWRNSLDLFQGDFLFENQCISRGNSGKMLECLLFPSCFLYFAVSYLPPIRKILNHIIAVS